MFQLILDEVGVQMEQFSIKHRPRSFEELYGQDGIRKDLIKRAQTKNWPRAMLLKGQFGTGKTTSAHIIAMHIQCTKPTAQGQPCGECSSCKSILNERFDRDTEMLDGGTMGLKENLIKLVESVNIRPMYDKNRVFIIEEADQLTAAAFSTLLKILEAPQDGIYFILLSMTTNGVPAAVQSRCQAFNFKAIPMKDTMLAMKSILEKESIWDSPELPDVFKMQGLAAIAGSSKGSLREAMQLLERCLVGKYYTPEEIHDNLGIVDEAATYKILDGLLDYTKDETIWSSLYKSDAGELYNYITLLLANAMIYKQTGFVENELYAYSTKSLAGSENLEALFTALTDYPQLTKPYTRQADLLSAIAKYYAKAVKPSISSIPAGALPVRKIKT